MLQTYEGKIAHADSLKDVVGGGGGGGGAWLQLARRRPGQFQAQTHMRHQTSTLTFRGSACGSVYDQRGEGRLSSDQQSRAIFSATILK